MHRGEIALYTLMRGWHYIAAAVAAIAVSLFLAVLPSSAFGIELAESGTFGSNLSYTFAADTGELTISMVDPDDTSFFEAWYFQDCEQINTVRVSEGINLDSNGIFSGCSSLETVYLPASLAYITFDVFSDCDNLKDVYYSGSVEDWSKVEISDSNDSLANAVIHCADGDVTYTPPARLGYSVSDIKSVEFFNSRPLIAGFDESVVYGIGAKVTMSDDAQYTIDLGYRAEYDYSQPYGGELRQLDEMLELSCEGEEDPWAVASVESGSLDAPGSITVAMRLNSIFENVTCNNSVVVEVIENPVKSLSVSDESLTQKLGINEILESYGGVIERCDIAVSYADGTSMTFAQIAENESNGIGGWAYADGSCSLFIHDTKVCGDDFTESLSVQSVERNRVEYVLGKELSELQVGETYPMIVRYMGAELTTYIEVMEEDQLNGNGGYEPIESGISGNGVTFEDYDLCWEDDALIANGQDQMPEGIYIAKDDESTDSYTTLDSQYYDLTVVAEYGQTEPCSHSEPGYYWVCATGKNGYEGRCWQGFRIYSANDIERAEATVADSYFENWLLYTGEAVFPSITLKLDGATLAQGADYTVSYYSIANGDNYVETPISEPIEKGHYVAKLTAVGSYSGSRNVYFDIIDQINLSDVWMESIDEQEYSGKQIKPDLHLDYEGSLSEGKDYTVAYKNNVNAGTATVTVTGKGFFTGSRTETFKILPHELYDIEVSGISDKVYTGKAFTPAPTVKWGSKTLKSGTDYTVSYKNNVNSGEAVVLIKGKGNYAETYEAYFWIDPAPLFPSATVTGITAKSYTGKNIAQSPTVKIGSTTLKKGVDYRLTYWGNKNVGTASMEIKGIGNYEGWKTFDFKITKAATFAIAKAKNTLKAKAKTATVKASKLKKKAQTVAVKKALSVSKAKGAVSYAKVKKGSSPKLSINKKTGKITVKKGTKAGTYKMKVKVTAKGNANYKAASKTVTVKVKVK